MPSHQERVRRNYEERCPSCSGFGSHDHEGTCRLCEGTGVVSCVVKRVWMNRDTMLQAYEMGHMALK
jgi:DnaJ-class molecular chaperone